MPEAAGPRSAPRALIRPATAADLAQITAIYNHYVVHTPITFDVRPFTVDERRQWFAQFAPTGPHRLVVAEDGGSVVGYAATHRFRPKAAYDTTVETTIYLAPERTGRGIGRMLYAALFAAIAGEDLRMAIAGITLPNIASIALHAHFGYTLTGVMHGIGRKLDRYWDVAWYEKRLDGPRSNAEVHDA